MPTTLVSSQISSDHSPPFGLFGGFLGSFFASIALSDPTGVRPSVLLSLYKLFPFSGTLLGYYFPRILCIHFVTL